jgi:hypothetical protein
MPRSIFIFWARQIPPKPLGHANGEIVGLQLFRLVAGEYLIGKSLTGGGSRRYLWASL